MTSDLTGLFTISEPNNQEIAESFEARECYSTDLRSEKLGKGRSCGRYFFKYFFEKKDSESNNYFILGFSRATVFFNEASNI